MSNSFYLPIYLIIEEYLQNHDDANLKLFNYSGGQVLTVQNEYLSNYFICRQYIFYEKSFTHFNFVAEIFIYIIKI